MEFKTVILRFRDLVTESSGTIARHKDMIKKKGYVWWGWWNKGNEKVPFDDLFTLSGAIKFHSEDFFLMDSGQRKLYKAKCCAIEHFREKTPSPNKKYTPTYYNKQTYYAWFKFDKIEECNIDEVKKYTYVKVDSLFAENSSNYDKFYGKRITALMK